MKYVRVERMGKIRWGVLNGDIVHTLKYPPYSETTEYYDGKKWPLESCRLLYPCEPSKVVCVKRWNSVQTGKAGETIEGAFHFDVILPDCLVGHKEFIHVPDGVQHIECEFGIALVIKKFARQVKATEVWSYILGLACFNKLSPKETQRGENIIDESIAIGPVVTDEVNPADLELETRLNGEPVLFSRISNFNIVIPQIVELITSRLVLEAGDVVTIGAFTDTNSLLSGSAVEFDIKGIGVLENQTFLS